MIAGSLKLDSADRRVAGRNPNWTRDELILALDVYMRHRAGIPDRNSPEVIELSEMLNRLGHAGRGRLPTYRNANGVAMKLSNFRAFDPDYTSSGRLGLHHTGRSDEEVWREFAEDPVRLRQTAAAIRTALAGASPAPGTSSGP